MQEAPIHTQTRQQGTRFYAPLAVTLLILLPFLAMFLRQVNQQKSYQNSRGFRLLSNTASRMEAEFDRVRKTVKAFEVLSSPLQRNKGYPAGLTLQGFGMEALGNLNPVFLKIDAKGEGKGTCIQGSFKADLFLEDCGPDSFYLRAKVGGDSLEAIQVSFSKLFELAEPSDKQEFFDGLIAFDPYGRVLAQSGANPPHLEKLSDLNFIEGNDSRLGLSGVSKSEVREGSSSKSQKKGESIQIVSQEYKPEVLKRMLAGSGRFEAEIAGRSYVLLVQPSNTRIRIMKRNLDEEMKFEGEQLIFLCGFLSREKLEASYLDLPGLHVPAILMGLAAAICLLWPLLKLYTMAPYERLKRSDVINIAVGSLIATSISSLMVMEWGLGAYIRQRTNTRLENIAEQVRQHVHEELKRALDEIHQLGPHLLAEEWIHGPLLNPTSKAYLSLAKLRVLESGHKHDPADKKHTLAESPYPYFRHFVFGKKEKDGDFKQVMKVTADQLPTPLIDLPRERFPGIYRLEQGKTFKLCMAIDSRTAEGECSKTNWMPFSFDVLHSPNTGEFLPAIYKDYVDKNSFATSVLLSLPMISLVNPILPEGFGMAIINADGKTLFHSNRRKNLREVFLDETNASGAILERIRNGGASTMAFRYDGEEVEAVVTRLEDLRRFKDIDWGIIVFRKVSYIRSLQSQVAGIFMLITLFIVFFGGAALALGWKYLTKIRPLGFRWANFFWPLDVRRHAYVWMFGFGATSLLGLVVLLSLGLDHLSCLVSICFWNLFCLTILWLRFNGWFVWFMDARKPPLRTAYSLGMMSTVLLVVVPFLVTVFVFSTMVVQHCHERMAHSYLQRAIDDRNEQIRARLTQDLQDLNAEDKTSEAAELLKIIENRKNLLWDVYDPRFQNTQESLLPFSPASELWLRPAVERMWGSEGKLWSALGSPAPQVVRASGGTQLPPWYPMPGVLKNAKSGNGYYFLFRFWLVIVSILTLLLIWLRAIVTRLFLLGDLGYERIPSLSPIPEELKDRTRRILVLSHPLSGSSKFIRELVAQEQNAILIDFAKISSRIEALSAGQLESLAKAKLILLDNFEVLIDDLNARRKKLQILEQIVFDCKGSLLIFSSIDPVLYVESISKGMKWESESEAELRRWSRVMGTFDRRVHRMAAEDLSVADYKTTEAATDQAPFLHLLLKTFHVQGGDQVSFFRFHADAYYRMLWALTTPDERLVLYQLARDGWVNPQNRIAIAHLLSKDLIRLERENEGRFLMINRSFQRFVLDIYDGEAAELAKGSQNASLWSSLRISILGVAVSAVLWFFYVRQDLFDVYFSYGVALLSGGAWLIRAILQSFQRGPTLAKAVGGSREEA